MRILVQHDGQQLGPWTLDELRAALAARQVRGEDLGWQEGTEAWVPVSALLMGKATSSAPPFQGHTMGGQTSGLAITSLVLGIGSLLCGVFTGIPAVICGHLAKGQIRRSGGQIQGSGLATAGLITGYLGIILAIVGVVAVMNSAMPAFGKIKAQADAAMLTNQGIKVHAQCIRFAGENGGRFPETLEELLPNYLQNKADLADAMQKGSEENAWNYFGSGMTVDATLPDAELLRSKREFGGDRVVVKVDGEVELRK